MSHESGCTDQIKISARMNYSVFVQELLPCNLNDIRVQEELIKVAEGWVCVGSMPFQAIRDPVFSVFVFLLHV